MSSKPREQCQSCGGLLGSWNTYPIDLGNGVLISVTARECVVCGKLDEQREES